MLNILLSRHNQIIEEKIFQSVCDNYASGEEIYILVPEQFTLQNEIKLMEHLDFVAVSRAKILSFQRLALEALSKVGGIKRKHIDTVGKAMMVKNILSKNKDIFKYYAKSVDKEGFIDALLNQIAELKRTDVSPESLKICGENLQNADLLSQKLYEFAEIYTMLESELSDKYVDNDDRLGQLAEIKNLSYLKGKRIYIYSFVDFTAIEEKIIYNLLSSGLDITIGLCFDINSVVEKDETVFDAAYRTFNILRKIANETGVECSVENIEENPKISKELLHLNEQLFRVINLPYEEECKNVEIFAAHFIEEEVENIARKIQKLVVEKGYRYRDFMVVSGELPSYSGTVKQVFAQYDIPYFLDEKRDIISSPIIKMIVSAINMLGGDFSTENIMVFLKNDFANMGESVEKIYDFENYLISKRLKGKMFLDDRYFIFEEIGKGENAEKDIADEQEQEEYEIKNLTEELSHNTNSHGKVLAEKIYYDKSEKEKELPNGIESIGDDDRDDLDDGKVLAEKIKLAKTIEKNSSDENEREKYQRIININDIRNKILNIFAPAMKKAEVKKTAGEFGEIIYNLLEEYDMVSKIQYLVDELKRNDLLDEANENNQVWNIFVRILEQADEVFRETEMSLSDYKNIVLKSLKSYKLSVIPPAQDQVIVGDIERSRSDSKEIVFICAVNSGNIPKVYQESGVFSQEEKSILSKLGIDLPSEKDRVSDIDRLKVYNLFTRAKEKLFVSYSMEGSRMPSPYITTIKEIFPKIKTDIISEHTERDFVSLPRPTISKLALELKKYSKGEEISDLWLEAKSYYSQDGKTADMLGIALDGIFYNNEKPNITSAKKLYKSPLKLSTTRIKSFEECPFKHFVKYGLRAKERKEFIIEPSEMGIVLHGTVEEVVRDLKKSPEQIFDITKEQMDKMVDEYFESSIAKNLREYDIENSRNRFLLKRLKNVAKKISYSSVEHLRAGEFELLAQEARFDDDSQIPPIILQIGDTKVKLVGTIDRIDVLKDGEKSYIKVIDYKTANKTFSLSDAYNNLDIQLMVYMSAVLNSKKLVKNEKYPAGVFYFPITETIVEESTRDREKLSELIREKIKMDGLVIDEEIILKGLDKNFSSDGKGASKIYNSGAKNKITKEQFDMLLEHIHSNIEKSLGKIMSGEILAKPVIINGKKDDTGCKYCRYGSICRFEEELGDSYRPVYDYKNDDIFEKLMIDRAKGEKGE